MSPDVINIDIAKPVGHTRGMSMSHHIDGQSASVAGAGQMPMESEVNRRFKEVVVEMELPVDKQVQLFSMPIDKKWQIVVSKCAESDEKKGATVYPEYYIDNIKR